MSGHLYYTYPAGSAPDGTEVVGPVRQAGQDVTLTLAAVTAAGGAATAAEAAARIAADIALLSSTAANTPTPRLLSGRFSDRFNALDFGAKGDGSTNDDAALAALFAACSTYKKAAYIPATGAPYVVSTAKTLTGPIDVFGDFGATTIKTTSASNDIFDLAGANVSVHDLCFDSSAARTGGAYLAMPGTVGNVKVERCYLANHSTGIGITGSGSAIIDVSNCYLFNAVASTGVGILVSGNPSDVSLRHLVMNSGASPQPFAGIELSNAGDVVLDDCNIIQHRNDLLLNPGSGQVVSSLYASNSYFDTSSDYGLLVLPSGTGAVVRCRFIGCWFSSHGIDGARVTGAGTVTGLEFIDCHAFSNSGNGFYLVYGSGFTFVGCQGAGNPGAALSVAAGISGLTATANTFGPAGGIGANGNGIFIAAGAGDHIIVANNQLQGNTTAALANGATGSHTITTPNLTA